MLTARKSDLELQVQFVQQAQLQLENILAQLLQVPSPPAQQIQAIQQSLATLNSELDRLNEQIAAVQSEIDEVRKVIGNNIERGLEG
jgi:chromosome segregation ATPase